MAVDVPGMGEEKRGPSGGLELERQETQEVRRDKMWEGEETAWPRCIFLNLSVSRLSGQIDF